MLTETLANREEEEAQARAPFATKTSGKIATPTKGDEKSRRKPPPPRPKKPAARTKGEPTFTKTSVSWPSTSPATKEGPLRKKLRL